MHPACAAAWTFLTDLKDVHSLLDEYCSPQLKLAYDTYHFPFDSRHRKLLTQLAPSIGIVHLSDRRVPPNVEQERCPLGCGRLPLADIVTTLQEAGYTGAFDVKLIGQEIERGEYWRLLEHSQLAFAGLVNPVATRSFA
jgi:sugar phosphate isomerase/epimerase